MQTGVAATLPSGNTRLGPGAAPVAFDEHAMSSALRGSANRTLTFDMRAFQCPRTARGSVIVHHEDRGCFAGFPSSSPAPTRTTSILR
jgi:hypothetical protein